MQAEEEAAAELLAASKAKTGTTPVMLGRTQSGGLQRSKSTLGDYGSHPTALTRGKSFINRFNPGESEELYKKKHETEVMETLLWMKLKLMVNQAQKEMPEKIEAAWQVSEMLDSL